MLAFLVAETGAQKKQILRKSRKGPLELWRTRKTKMPRKSKVKRTTAKGRRSARKCERKPEMLQKSSNAKLKLRRTRKTKKLRKSKVKRMIAKGRRSAQKCEAKSKKQKSSKAKLKLRDHAEPEYR